MTSISHDPSILSIPPILGLWLSVLVAPGCSVGDSSETTSFGSGGPTSGDAEAGTRASAAETSMGATSAGTDGTRYDLGPTPDSGTCQGGGTSIDFSDIWIANSAAGTVSKIDTRTATELARYQTRANPPTADLTYALRGPSRTSVNLSGDVAVVNRDDWGAVKIAARRSECVDRNNNQVIDTSTGAGDVRGWSSTWPPEDECILWHTPLPSGSRPAAWTSGTATSTECGDVYSDMQLWAAAPDPAQAGGAMVYLLDGDTGDIVQSTQIPASDCQCPVYGPYGGAVDADNNLWTFGQDGSSPVISGASWGFGPLIKVDFVTLDHTVYPFPNGDRPGYGIMVDRDGRPWVAGFEGALYRFNPGPDNWTQVDLSGLAPPYNGTTSTLRGIQQDADGDIWVALAFGYPTMFGSSEHGLLRVDAATASVKALIDSSVLTGLKLPAGISVDVEGFVWIVDTLSNAAFKVDPADYSFETVSGLQNPYTYSDMTGFGLRNVGNPAG